MVILLGSTSSSKMLQIMKQLGWGRLWSSGNIKTYPGELWGFDNGAFSAWKKKLPFPKDEFFKRLQQAQTIGTPYIAVAPDIVGEGDKSLCFSVSWLTELPQKWPWYLAVQDGMTLKSVKPFVKKFSGLFLGGTDEFKKQAFIWKEFSHDNGLKFHYARVSGERKFHHAMEVNPDSIDTTQPLWSWDKFNKFVKLATQYQPHPKLFPEEHYVL